MSSRRAIDACEAVPIRRGSGASSWLEERRQQVESHLDYLMATMPESRLEARRLCVEVLGATPSPELLQTLQLMAGSDAGPVRGGLGRQVVVLRLLADALFHELNGPTVLEPATLSRVNDALADLLALAWRHRDEADAWREEAPASEAAVLKRLERKLMPSLERIEAYRVLVPLLGELATAAMNGRIMAVDFLSDREAALFADAIPGRIDGVVPPERIWLNAAALRFGMERDLVAWNEAREAAAAALATGRGDADTDGEAGGGGPGDDTDAGRDGAQAGPIVPDPADDPRRPALARVQADMNAYKVVVARLQARQDEARAAGQPLVVERTSSVQKALFASYLRLSAEARKTALPGERSPDGRAESERERLIEEARHADDGDVRTEEEKRDEILADALTGMREGPRAVVTLPPGSVDPGREKRARRILVGVAVVLAIASVALNVSFIMQNRRAAASAPPSPADYAPAMNVQQTDPLGPVIMIEVAAADWSALTPAEREIRMDELGRLANDDGFSHVMVSDEAGGRLGQWSAGRGSSVVVAGGAPSGRSGPHEP